MKKSEIIQKYSEAISASMVEAYRTVIGCAGKIQYQIYIWEDGELELLEGPQGDSGYLKPYDCEPRELFYVCTVSEPFCNLWDAAGESAPDDETEREQMEAEIIDWLVDEYEAHISDLLDSIIEHAEFVEFCEESERGETE